jgi:hypothetical protein
MDTRTACKIIEGNLLWHRSEGGDREALVRGIGFWTYADLVRVRDLLDEELFDRDLKLLAHGHYDELELWLGDGQ